MSAEAGDAVAPNTRERSRWRRSGCYSGVARVPRALTENSPVFLGLGHLATQGLLLSVRPENPELPNIARVSPIVHLHHGAARGAEAAVGRRASPARLGLHLGDASLAERNASSSCSEIRMERPTRAQPSWPASQSL